MAGKYFEEFRVGDVFKHQPGRTVTETDNLLFSTLTMNPQPLHLDAEFSKNTEFGRATRKAPRNSPGQAADRVRSAAACTL